MTSSRRGSNHGMAKRSSSGNRGTEDGPNAGSGREKRGYIPQAAVLFCVSSTRNESE